MAAENPKNGSAWNQMQDRFIKSCLQNYKHTAKKQMLEHLFPSGEDKPTKEQAIWKWGEGFCLKWVNHS